MSVFPPLPLGKTIGLLGGGQLGLMLAEAAKDLGYETIVYDPDKDCPASRECGEHIAAAWDNEAALERFASVCDVVTFEFESIPVETLRIVKRSVAVRPSPDALEIAQDRLKEKLFVRSLRTKTAPFFEVNGRKSLIAALKRCNRNTIVKKRRFGYDGKGQIPLEDDSKIDAVLEEIGSNPAIVECFVDFAWEMSIIAARGANGKIVAYDPVCNRHENGILRSSTVPAPLLTPAMERKAVSITGRILEKLDYVGVIGVEFFVMEDGQCLVNEIAPRVHNSGHWTEAACKTSQFEQHIRAICGLPLGSVERHRDCEMTNLLGKEIDQASEIKREKDAVLREYGKVEVREGRKMGHVTRLKESESLKPEKSKTSNSRRHQNYGQEVLAPV